MKIIKLKKLIIIILFIFFIIFGFKIIKNKLTTQEDLKVPKLTIKNENSSINAFIDYCDYNDEKYYTKNYDKNQYLIDASNSSYVVLEFENLPHEYFVSNEDIKIIKNKLILPNEKGIYDLKIGARWYDKGFISYKFSINVE